MNNPTSANQTNTTKMTTRRRASPALTLKIEHMRIPLAPLYALPNGQPHSSFPKTLLHYWLLTEDQCDSIAHWYHQTSPTNQYRLQYPETMRWDTAFLAKPNANTMSKEEMKGCLSDEERLKAKRRMVGKFIGLKGCETPITEINRKVKFLEDRFERSIKLDREYICPKFPG